MEKRRRSKLKTSEIQAIMAGNFLNLGLMLAFLQREDMAGQGLIILSWIAAYLGGFLMSGRTALPNNLAAYWAVITFMWLCLVCSAFAIVRFIFV